MALRAFHLRSLAVNVFFFLLTKSILKMLTSIPYLQQINTRRLSIYEAAIRTNGAKMDKFRKNGQIHAEMDKLINSGQIKVSFVRISAPLSGFAQICPFFPPSIGAEVSTFKKHPWKET